MIIFLKLVSNNMSLEISIQNLRNRVNLVDNESRTKNILINYVGGKLTENAIQLITKVNQIMHDVDNTIHATHPYRIGQINKSKPQPRLVLKLISRNMQLLNMLTDLNAQQNFKMNLIVKISVIILKSLDRNSSRNIRKWSNNTEQFAWGELN